MNIKPRTALYSVLSSVRFLIISILFSVSLLIAIMANVFTLIAEEFSELPMPVAYVLGFILNALAIAAMWTLFAGAKKRSTAAVNIGFKFLAVYAFALAAAVWAYVLINDIATATEVLSLTDSYQITDLIVDAFIGTATFGFFVYVFVVYGISALAFAKTARYNKSLAKLPMMVCVVLILSSFSQMFFWQESFVFDLSFSAFSMKLAASILVLILSVRYARLSPRMSRDEMRKLAAELSDPELRKAVLEEAEIEGDPITRVEKNASNGESAATHGWNENLTHLRAFASMPFESGVDYSDSDRFNVLYSKSYAPVPREPLSITAVSLIDDLLTGRRVLRVRAINNAPIDVQSASFHVVLADKSGQTIGEMSLPNVGVNSLQSGAEGFDNYAFILPDETEFGVVKLTRVDLSDGLYWDKGGEYYRFMTVDRTVTPERVEADDAVSETDGETEFAESSTVEFSTEKTEELSNTFSDSSER